MMNKINVVELDSKTGILHYELLKVLFLFDSIRKSHFEQDPDQVDEMSEKERAYAFSSSYEPLYYCMDQLQELLEGAVKRSELVRDLVGGVEKNAS